MNFVQEREPSVSSTEFISAAIFHTSTCVGNLHETGAKIMQQCLSNK